MPSHLQINQPIVAKNFFSQIIVNVMEFLQQLPIVAEKTLN